MLPLRGGWFDSGVPTRSTNAVPEPGMSHSFTHSVVEDDTAEALGSGEVPVLATPRILALAEAATVRAVAGAIPEGSTTVGTQVSLNHLTASPVGADVEVRAELIGVQGRQLTFSVVVGTMKGDLLARGQVTRVVVDRERFLTRVPAP